MENTLTKLLRYTAALWENVLSEEVNLPDEVRMLLTDGITPGDTVPPAWQPCLQPGSRMAASLAARLAQTTGATPARYGLAAFCPEEDAWVLDLLNQFAHSRLFFLLTGKQPLQPAPTSAYGLTPYGAERLVTDWIVCVDQADGPLQRVLCPQGGDLYDYLAAGAVALLTNGQPLWFSLGVVPIRATLRDWLEEHLTEDLHNLLAARKKSDRTLDATHLRTLQPLRKEVARAPVIAWLKSNGSGLTYREVGRAATTLVNLLLPYPSKEWSAELLENLPGSWLSKGYRMYRKTLAAVPPEQQPFAQALPQSFPVQRLRKLLAGQTPATYDGVVKLRAYLNLPAKEPLPTAADLARSLREAEQELPGQPTSLWEDLVGFQDLEKGRAPAQRRQSALLRFVLLQLLGVNGAAGCYGGEEALREKSFRLGLALSLSTDALEQTLLHPLDMPGVDYKNAGELIYAYCADHSFLPACRWAMARWMQLIYVSRKATAASKNPPSTLRLTRYWRTQYQDWYGETPRNPLDFLQWMADQGLPLYHASRGLPWKAAATSLYLYGNARYRAGRMLLSVADTLLERKLEELRNGIRTLDDALKKYQGSGDLLQHYQTALCLTSHVGDAWLRNLLAQGMLPWFPAEGPEPLRKALLEDLLDRIQKGSTITRTDLLQMGTVWYFLTQTDPLPEGQRLSLLQQMGDLQEQLNILLTECRFQPYDPNHFDEPLDNRLLELLRTRS